MGIVANITDVKHRKLRLVLSVAVLLAVIAPPLPAKFCGLVSIPKQPYPETSALPNHTPKTPNPNVHLLLESPLQREENSFIAQFQTQLVKEDAAQADKKNRVNRRARRIRACPKTCKDTTS